MLSSPVYAYGINLLPPEGVAEAVMQLNTQLAQEVRETGVTFTLADLDARFRALFQQLEGSGAYRRGEDLPPILTKEQCCKLSWAPS
jgi:hypothetical protein